MKNSQHREVDEAKQFTLPAFPRWEVGLELLVLDDPPRRALGDFGVKNFLVFHVHFLIQVHNLLSHPQHSTRHRNTTQHNVTHKASDNLLMDASVRSYENVGEKSR